MLKGTVESGLLAKIFIGTAAASCLLPPAITLWIWAVLIVVGVVVAKSVD